MNPREPLSDLARQLIRDGCAPPPEFPPLASYPAPVQAGVAAYDEARMALHPVYAGLPMSEAEQRRMAPLIAAAIAAAAVTTRNAA